MAINIVLGPADHSFSKNLIPLVIETGEVFGGYLDIVISATTEVYNGDWFVLAKQRLYVNQLGKAEIDLSSIFDAGFSFFDKIDLEDLTIQNPIGKIQRAKYEIQVYHYNGDVGDDTSGEFDVYRGGIPRQYEKTVDALPWLIDNKKWFTWKPKTTVVSMRQPEWLTIKLPFAYGISTFDIKFVVTDTLGNTYNKTVSKASVAASGNNIYFVPVGFNDNDLGALTGVFVPSFYTVTAYEGGTATKIAETRKYIIDHINRPFERFFMFTNSLGGFDTLRTIGEATPKSVFTDIEADVNPSITVNEPPNQRLESTEEYSKIINTGFRSKEENNWLRDFRMAVDVYELETENMIHLQPIRFLKKELIPSKDDQDLHALQFEYKYAYDNSVFAPIPIHDE